MRKPVEASVQPTGISCRGRNARSARRAVAARTMPFTPNRGEVSLPAEELIHACIDTGDAEAWQEFVRRTHPVIAATVVRTARRFGEAPQTLIADLVQETYLRICENRCRVLRDFRAEHPDAIFGLMRTIAFSVAQDHFRAGLAGKRGSGRPEQPVDSCADSLLAGEGAGSIERQILLEEIDRFLAGSGGDRRIFWLYYWQGLTTRAIAGLPGIGLTQKGVESTIHRLTGRIKEWLAERRTPEKAKGKGSGSAL